MALGYGRTATNNFSVSKFIVDTNGIQNGATHTTIASAVAAASSGDTIYIRPGTYTENITLPGGINLCGYTSDGAGSQIPFASNTKIVGKITQTAAGTSVIANLALETNSDFFLEVSGSAASIVILKSCYLSCLNNTGISHTSSSSDSQIFIEYCFGSFGTTGIGFWAKTSPGSFFVHNSNLFYGSATSTQSTVSSGQVNILNSFLNFPVSCSSTGAFRIKNTTIECNNQNAVAVTTAGTGASEISNSHLKSGSASAVSIGSGTSINMATTTIECTNTNSITGAGTLTYSGIALSSTSTAINPTTSTARAFLPGRISFDNGTNYLDKYEEGTFSPTVIGTSTPGTATYSIQIGNYTRIGNRLYFTINLAWSSGSGTGNLRVDGLPFTANASNGTSPVSINFGSNLTIAAGIDQAFAFVLANTTQIGLGVVDYNTSGPAIAYDADAGINISGFYYI